MKKSMELIALNNRTIVPLSLFREIASRVVVEIINMECEELYSLEELVGCGFWNGLDQVERYAVYRCIKTLMDKGILPLEATESKNLFFLIPTQGDPTEISDWADLETDFCEQCGQCLCP